MQSEVGAQEGATGDEVPPLRQQVVAHLLADFPPADLPRVAGMQAEGLQVLGPFPVVIAPAAGRPELVLPDVGQLMEHKKFFNVKKGIHNLKTQVAVTPDSMVVHLKDPDIPPTNNAAERSLQTG